MLIWLLLALFVGLVLGVWLGIHLNLHSLRNLGLGLDQPKTHLGGSKNVSKNSSKNNSKTNSKGNSKSALKTNTKHQSKMTLYQRLSATGIAPSQGLRHRILLSLRRSPDAQKLGLRLEQNLLAVWHRAPIGYLQVDAENHLVWCNLTAANLLGIANYQSGITKGQFLLQLVRSYELDQLIENTRHQGQPNVQEWVWYPLVTDPLAPVMRGAKVTLRGLSFPLDDGHIGIFLENRQEVITLIEQRDRWIADVTHELKTPLTAIRLVGELLETRLEPNLQPWMSRLLGEVNRLSELVQDILELARLSADSKTNSLRHTQADLVCLIDQAWESLNLISAAKQIALDYQGPDQCPMTIDTQCIQRLLINLLDNSLKHSPPQQTIIVRLTKFSLDHSVTSAPVSEKIEDSTGCVNENFNENLAAYHNPTPNDYHNNSNNSASNILNNAPTNIQGKLNPNHDHNSILLEIIDHGSGFNPVDLPHIFERFYRGDQSRKRTESGAGGSGLGLAIVKQIVQLHCGEITINNHPDTGGAWVKVILPLAPLTPSSDSSHSFVSNS